MSFQSNNNRQHYITTAPSILFELPIRQPLTLLGNFQESKTVDLAASGRTFEPNINDNDPPIQPRPFQIALAESLKSISLASTSTEEARDRILWESITKEMASGISATTLAIIVLIMYILLKKGNNSLADAVVASSILNVNNAHGNPINNSDHPPAHAGNLNLTINNFSDQQRLYPDLTDPPKYNNIRKGKRAPTPFRSLNSLSSWDYEPNLTNYDADSEKSIMAFKTVRFGGCHSIQDLRLESRGGC